MDAQMRIVGDYLENVQAIICALNVTVKTFIVLQRSLLLYAHAWSWLFFFAAGAVTTLLSILQLPYLHHEDQRTAVVYLLALAHH